MKLQKITPDLARGILAKNENNRIVNNEVVSRYAKAMVDGKWKFNGDTIALDKNGNLINGQHRLKAVVQSNKTIDGLIVDGLDPDVFTTIDIGRRRSGADALVVATGTTNATNSSAVCSALIRHAYCAEKGIRYSRTSRNNIDHNDIIDMFNSTPNIVAYIQEWSRTSTLGKFIPPSQYSALRVLFDRASPEDSVKFFKLFDSGANLGNKNPINALRNRFIDNLATNDGGRMNRDLSLNLVIKAWNLWRNKKQVAHLAMEAGDTCEIR